MANTLQIKRSTTAGNVPQLAAGELGANLPDNTLYVGQDAYTKLLVHSDTTDGSTTFTDASPSGHTVTAVNQAQHSTTYKKFGASAIKFDGAGDYLTVPDSSDFELGTGDFTIETWVRFNSIAASGQTILINQYNSGTDWIFQLNNAKWSFYSNTAYHDASTGPSLNTWYHFAVVRDTSTANDTITLYVDGVSVLSYNGDHNITGAGVLEVGSYGSGASLHTDGYLDEIRISNVARFTAAFTPPTRRYGVMSPEPTGDHLPLSGGDLTGHLSITGADNTSSKLTLTNTAADNTWGIHPNYNTQDLKFLADSTLALTLADTGSATFEGNINATGGTFTGALTATTVEASAAAGARTGLQVGTGSTANAGWVLGNYSSGVSGMWPTRVTPSSSNYDIYSGSFGLLFNTPAGGVVQQRIANAIITSASSTGLAVTGAVTATGGFDGTLGATTPATVAATTITASGLITRNSVAATNTEAVRYTGTTSGSNYSTIVNTIGSSYWGTDSSAGQFTGTPYAFFITSGQPIVLTSGGVKAAVITSTGLAVTGAISSNQAGGGTVFDLQRDAAVNGRLRVNFANAESNITSLNRIRFTTYGVQTVSIDSSGLAVTGAISATTTITNSSGIQGLQIREYTGGGGHGSIYSTNVTVGGSNFSFLTNAVDTRVSGTTSSSLDANAVTIAKATSTGLAVTGAVTASGLITKTGAAATLNHAITATGSTTSGAYSSAVNTGCTLYTGIEGSGASGLMVGSSAYAGIINVTTATSLQLGTSNTTRLTIDSAGKVGIGTDAPGAKLEIDAGGATDILLGVISDSTTYNAISLNGAITDAGKLGFAGGGGGNTNSQSKLYYDVPSTGQHVFRVATSQKVVFDASGKVGIGTAGPSSLLEIGASSNTTDQLQINGPTSTTKLHIGQFSNGAYIFSNYRYRGGHSADSSSLGSAGIVISADSTSGAIAFDRAVPSATPSRTTSMVIANTGNVGIGTTAPNAYSNKKTLEINATWGGVIENSVSGTVKSRWDWSTGGITQFGTYVNEPLHLITNSSMAVTILGDGKVGIGTDTPPVKLTISDVANDTRYGGQSWSRYLMFDCNNSGGGGIIWNKQSTSNNRGIVSNHGDLFFMRSDQDDNSGSAYHDMTIKADGKVGIGTTAPATSLDVRGSGMFGDQTTSIGSHYQLQLSRSNDPVMAFRHLNAAGVGQLDYVDFYFKDTGGTERLAARFGAHHSVTHATQPGADFIFSTTPAGGSLTERMRINDDGKVGIGTSTFIAGEQLGVSGGDNDGTIIVTTNNATVRDAGYWMATDYDGTANYAAITLDQSDDALKLFNANSIANHLVIKNDGNVGIGTASPGAKLQVHDGGIYAGNGATKGYGFHDFGTGWGYKGVTSPSRLGIFTDANERVTILGDGKVGIGTNAPLELLHVQGTNDASDVSIRIKNLGTSNGTRTDLDFHYSTADRIGGRISCYLDDTSTNSTSMHFLTRINNSSGERMRIDSAGKVGIGTTAPGSVLEVNHATNCSFTLSSAGTGAGQGSYMRIINAGYIGRAGRLYGDTTNNLLISGDNKIIFGIGSSYTEEMRIDAAGKVGIGTTSPRNKLQVEGSIEIGNWSTSGSRYVGFSRSDTGAFGTHGASGLEIESGTWSGNGSYDQKVHIWTHTYNGGSYRRLTVDHSGNVGIGATSPGSYKLYVNGTTKSGSVHPLTDNAHELGNTSLRWSSVTAVAVTGVSGTFSGALTATGNITTQGYVQHTGHLYSRDSLSVLNAAGTGWKAWATRSNSEFNLDVGTIAATTGTFGGHVTGSGSANPGGLGGSRYVLDWFGGSARYFSYGADASTNGSFIFNSQRSNGTNSVDCATISSTGLAVTGTGSFSGALSVPGGIKDKNNSTGSASHVLHSDGVNRVYWTTASTTIPGSVTNKYYTYIQLTTAAGDYYTITHSLGETDVNVTVRRAISGTGSRADRFNADAGRHFDVGAEVQVISCDANGAHSSNHISLWFDTYTVVNNEYVYVTVIG